MKSKNFALFGLSVLAVVVLMSLASAASLAITNVTYDASIDEGTTSFNFLFNLTNTGVEANVSFDSSTTSKGTITIPELTNLSENESTIVIGTITGISATATGSVDVLIHANPTGNGDNKTASFSVTITPTIDDFCEGTANKGELSVEIRDIQVNEGFGDDDEFWYPFDEVEIEFKVENNGDWDIQNADIEICLFDVDKDRCVYDEGDMDLSEDSPDIDSGDDVTITATFTIDADDLVGGNEDYIIYVRATGEIDDKDSPFDEEDTCSFDSEDIEIRTNENFVLLGDLDFLEIVSCAGELRITADVWNLDDSKAKDVVINVYNKELGLNKDIEIGDIGDFDSESFDFSFTIPSSATEKYYGIVLTVLDDDNDVYQNSEDDDSEYTLPVKVEGGCSTSPTVSNVIVSASIQSGGKAGEDLVIKATITNTGTSTVTYLVGAAGYGSWASAATVSQSSLTLASGQSQEVLITIKVNNDAKGDNTFNIELLSNGQLALSQPVSVTIDGSGSFSLSSIFGDNWYLWLIGAINVILVVVIIIVAIRVARKE